MLKLVPAVGVAIALASCSDSSTTTPDDNLAFAPGTATDEVLEVGQTTAAEVFTIRPGKVAATRKRAQDVFVGEAVDQYDRLYGSQLRTAQAQHLTLATSVRDVGVVWLNGEHAKLLVLADQTASTPSGRSSRGSAQFVLDLRRTEGAWKISSIRLI